MNEKLKVFIKNHLHFLVEPMRLLLHPSYLPNFLEKRKLNAMAPSDRFRYYYDKGVWKNDETHSGPDSRMIRTEHLRNELPSLLLRFNISTLLDLPCGDFNWMQHVDLGSARYTGADVVEKLVESNSRNFSSDKISFSMMDILKDAIPRYDLIICRDCLVHFSFKDIFTALKGIKASGSEFLLTTTFTSPDMHNYDIMTGEWRPINLELPPFSFPAPLLIIEETAHTGRNDKSMGLWRISGLP